MSQNVTEALISTALTTPLPSATAATVVVIPTTSASTIQSLRSNETPQGSAPADVETPGYCVSIYNLGAAVKNIALDLVYRAFNSFRNLILWPLSFFQHAAPPTPPILPIPNTPPPGTAPNNPVPQNLNLHPSQPIITRLEPTQPLPVDPYTDAINNFRNCFGVTKPNKAGLMIAYNSLPEEVKVEARKAILLGIPGGRNADVSNKAIIAEIEEDMITHPNTSHYIISNALSLWLIKRTIEREQATPESCVRYSIGSRPVGVIPLNNSPTGPIPPP
jgi:hypothetical protein